MSEAHPHPETGPCEKVCTASCAATCPSTPLHISLPEALERFQKEARLGVCDTGRQRCRYFTWGDGPPLVLLPGLGQTTQSWLMPLALLSRWFRCIACDFPTGIEDGARLRGYTHSDLVQDLWALLDHAGAKQTYVLASGFGSTVALAALRQGPQRLPRAVLHAPVARGQLGFLERLACRLLSHLPGRMRSLPLRERLLARLHQGPFSGMDPQLWDFYLNDGGSLPIRAVGRQGRLLSRVDLRSELTDIRQPVLLVWGDRDPLIRPGAMNELLARLPGSGHVVLEGAGHLPQLTHPAVLARVVQLFLTPPTTCPDHPAGDRVHIADCQVHSHPS